jgi:hypothetical protein
MKLLNREHGGMVAIAIAVIAILAVLAFMIAGGSSPTVRESTEGPGTVTSAPTAVPSTGAGR